MKGTAVPARGCGSNLCALLEWEEGGGLAAAHGERATRLPLERDRRLYAAGRVGDCVYVIESGVVKHVAIADDGGDAIVRLVTTGGVSGLEALAGLPYRHSAIVLHPGWACRVPVDAIKRYEQVDPTATEQLCRAWQQAVDDSQMLLRMTHGSALFRVASLLQFLGEVIPAGELIRIRRADIAGLFAIKEVSVARALSELRRRGLIIQRGRNITGIDPDIATLAVTAALHGETSSLPARANGAEGLLSTLVAAGRASAGNLARRTRGRPGSGASRGVSIDMTCPLDAPAG